MFKNGYIWNKSSIHYVIRLLKHFTMKTKNKLKVTIDAIGNGTRLEYLEKYPHGFVSVTKVHKSSKQYSRKNKSKKELWY